MKQLKITYFILSLFSLLLFVTGSYAQVDVGPDQSLLKGSAGSITFTSNNLVHSQFKFINNSNVTGGKIKQSNTTFGLTDGSGDWIFQSKLDEFTALRIGAAVIMNLEANGKVRIGDVDTSPNGYRLFVQEGILAEKVRVAVNGASDWADYVFEDDYDLMPLSDVKTFIEDNDHLPNVPSAEEMVNTGLDILESDAILLRKIEEAYLYILQQQEQLDELKKEIANLRN
jgi:hypothetical protein